MRFIKAIDHILRCIAGGNTGGYREAPREQSFTAINAAIFS